MDYQPIINVTDKINGQEKEWQRGDIILISSGTASGKSYFIRNKLEELAEEENTYILLLVNRSKLLRQTLSLLDSTTLTGTESRVKVELYQVIENEIKNGNKYDFSRFKYIVCDEAHYFTNDSGFNDDSDESLEAILQLNNHIRIFMSATGEVIFNHILDKFSNEKIWSYEILSDFSHIEHLAFYSETSSIERLINQSYNSPNDKIVWFVDSVDKALELHKKYKDDSLFVCSNSSKNKKYHKYINEEKVKQMVENNKFDCKYLFTTTALDNGFDLKDENIKLIICDLFQMETVLQCIGRKRFKDENDKVTVVLKNYSNKYIYERELENEKKIVGIEAFLTDGTRGFIKNAGKFGRNSSHIIKDTIDVEDKNKSNKKLSRPKFLQVLATRDRVKKMREDNINLNTERKMNGQRAEKDAYIRYMMQLLNKEISYLLEENEKQDELLEYLNNNLEKKLYKSDQNELISKFNLRDHNNRVQRSIEQFQTYLASNKLTFSLENARDNNRLLVDGSVNLNRNKRYWIIKKLEA